MKLIALVSVFLLAQAIEGAPSLNDVLPLADAECKLIPSNATPEGGPCPFTVSTSEIEIKKEDTIGLTLQAEAPHSFSEFLIFAVDVDGKPVGEFKSDINQNSKAIQCDDEGSAGRNKGLESKTEAKISWTAPQDFTGVVTFKTQFKQDNKFWNAEDVSITVVEDTVTTTTTTQPPPDECELVPSDATPEGGPCPFTVSTSKNNITKGDRIGLTLQAEDPSTNSFSEFLIFAVDVDGKPVGEFKSNFFQNSKAIQCDDKGSTGRNKGLKSKTEAKISWTAPQDFTGVVTFKTQFKQDNKFWNAEDVSITVVVDYVTSSTEHVTPATEDGNTSPSTEHVTPTTEDGNTSPSTEHVTPTTEDGNTSPSTEHVTPTTEDGNTSPSTEHVTPTTEDGNTSPSTEHVTPTTEDGNTTPDNGGGDGGAGQVSVFGGLVVMCVIVSLL